MILLINKQHIITLQHYIWKQCAMLVLEQIHAICSSDYPAQDFNQWICGICSSAEETIEVNHLMLLSDNTFLKNIISELYPDTILLSESNWRKILFLLDKYEYSMTEFTSYKKGKAHFEKLLRSTRVMYK